MSTNKFEIVIFAGGLPFDATTVKEKSLGGSESAAYYQARELAKRGHRVILFTSHPEPKSGDGVMYMSHGQMTEVCPLGETFTFYVANTPHDVLICQRHPLAFHKDWASKINIWQLHDVAIYRTGGAMQGGLPRIDFVTTVSQWHAEQVNKIWGIPLESIRVVNNGVDPELYDYGQIPVVPEGVRKLLDDGKRLLLYQSRPERGLEHLLRPEGIMAKLAAANSNAHLVYCGYENAVPQMQQYYAQLDEWGKQLPNVTNLGSLTKQDLADLQRCCDFLVYPTEFAEVSCITAMEAMHAGLPMITSKYAALAETCKGSGTVLIDLIADKGGGTAADLISGVDEGRADEAAFVSQILRLMDKQHKRDQLVAKQREAAQTRTWETAVDQLESAINEAFSRRNSGPGAQGRIARHLMEHSDILALDHYLGSQPPSPGFDGITLAAMDERASMYRFLTDDSLREHYEHWEGLNCDKLVASGMGNIANEIEMFTRTTRFRGVLQFVSRSIVEARARKARAHEEQLAAYNEDREALMRASTDGNAALDLEDAGPPDAPARVRVLEFGCAHGHLLLPIAKMFPEVDFVGVDFMSKSIKLAFEAAQEFKLGNITFTQRDHKQLGDDLGKFDCVIAAEVIEHVWDTQELLQTLADQLAPEGVMITTTPWGRWEWTGRDYWRKGREHLHHFEAADLMEIFGPWGIDRERDFLFAPAEGHDGTGGKLGSWLCSVKPNGEAPGTIDYERKFRQLAPRQTVSLCMIVKDGEASLRKSLLHVLPWVDQVVIGIDRHTTDDTEGVIKKLRAEFPQVPFDVFPMLSPLTTGFAVARNSTIDRATGDWILWQDCDEEVPGITNAWRLLRPSTFNAYACPQIHYSVAPAQVLTTDFPCRLFRNHRGVEFYGLVHEHPEDAPGKAVAHTMLAGDIQFLHGGYVDEPVRRARYQRNLPLLLRDVQENPERKLNKYLLLRDLAQSISFEQQLYGMVTQDMQERAQKGVELFHGMVNAEAPMLRMLVDALPYYSMCVETLGVHGAFDADITLGTTRVGTPTMAASVTVRGRFADRATYMKFITIIAEESTKHYESRYA